MTADVLGAAPPGCTLVGYSLGGRVALHVALAAPERVGRLVLVATTAGIEDEAERAARRAADAELAAFAEGATIEAFADRWVPQPLFADDPPQALAVARRDVLRNDPRALAAALRGLGTGTMAPLWDRLGELRLPATVVAGARDAKFAALGRRLADALPAGGAAGGPGRGARPAARGAGRRRGGDRRQALDAEARPAGHGDAAVLELEDVELAREERQGAEPAGRGRAQRGGAVHGGRDAQRPVEGRGDVDVGARGAHERGLGQQRR